MRPATTALAPMETTEAEPFRMRGTVVRVQETIQIDAVVLSGNSGGPLINVDGEVVGITSNTIENVLDFAIKVEWARNLLPGHGGWGHELHRRPVQVDADQ